MSIFDLFRKKKSVPMPWKKYYTEDCSFYDKVIMRIDSFGEDISIFEDEQTVIVKNKKSKSQSKPRKQTKKA